MRWSLATLSFALALSACTSAVSPAPVPPAPVISNFSSSKLVDLRFGFAPTPPLGPGYDPPGDAKALFLPGTASPATVPVPGTLITGSLGANERFVLRVPTAWNGNLIVGGTPAFRSEYADDFIWSELALSRGYAFASSNKTVSYNAVAETASVTTAPAADYPIPFNLAGLESGGFVFRFGVLTQGPSTIADWNNDFASLTTATKSLLVKNFGKGPKRTYAVGLSNGGGQVRSLLEQHPDLVDGGVDWSGVYWSQQANFLFYMPKFLAAMPAYISSGFTDAHAIATIKALGYPPDRLQPGSAHSSLWSDYYSTAIPYYSDLTVFAYARWLDSSTSSGFTGSVPCTPNAVNPIALPGTCTATGLALPASRAAYQPSAQAQSVFGSFAHTGLIGKPLVSVAGTADMFITPQNNALRYLAAVKAAGRGQLYHLYLVNGGTHVDTFAAFGYGLQPQLPFAWRAFDELVDIVEHNANPPGAGASATVNTPTDIPVP